MTQETESWMEHVIGSLKHHMLLNLCLGAYGTQEAGANLNSHEQ